MDKTATSNAPMHKATTAATRSTKDTSIMKVMVAKAKVKAASEQAAQHIAKAEALGQKAHNTLSRLMDLDDTDDTAEVNECIRQLVKDVDAYRRADMTFPKFMDINEMMEIIFPSLAQIMADEKVVVLMRSIWEKDRKKERGTVFAKDIVDAFMEGKTDDFQLPIIRYLCEQMGIHFKDLNGANRAAASVIVLFMFGGLEHHMDTIAVPFF